MNERSTRSELVAAMWELSLANGYEATRVDEVITRAGVSKGSFYHHFHSKEELAIAALDAYVDELTGTLMQYEVPDGSAVDKLFAFLDHVEQVAHGAALANGCLMGVFTVDLARRSEPVRVKLDEQFQALEQVVFEMIDAAATELGVVMPAWDLAVHFESVVEGALLLSKAHDDPAVLERGVRLFSESMRLRLGLGTAVGAADLTSPEGVTGLPTNGAAT